MRHYLNPYHPVADQSALYKAWENYVVKGVLSETIHQSVGESWEISRSTNLDPLISKIQLEPEDAFHLLLEKNQLLIDASEGIINNLKEVMEHSSSVIELFDNNGTMLKLVGDAKVLNRARHINNVPGGKIKEAAVGTNAVSLALKYQQPYLLSGSEHYCQMFHEWTCFAVPIFNRGNDHIIGVLDVTGPHNIFNNHTFGLIQTGAYAIEKIIHKQYLLKEYYLLDDFVRQMSKGFDLLLAINIDKRILRCQDLRSVLKLPSEQWAGKSVEDTALLGLSDFLRAPEDEAEFNLYVEQGNRLECRLARRYRDGDFIGWLLFVAVANSTVHTATSAPGSVFGHLIGHSQSFAATLDLARRVAPSGASVLILGETGTGKEEIAKAIHYESPRRNKPFISVNCGAIPSELIASELFGYEEGAFTGAKRGGAKGKFENAQGGTIFLDEIGELPLEQQVYLLRVLQEKKLQRVGGVKEIELDVRVIAATNVDLAAAVENKAFRSDLFYRLNVVTIKLPPLRVRGEEDIRALTYHFIRKFNQLEGKRVEFPEEVLARLCRYGWPGNVRELENVIYKLIVLSHDETVHPEDLSFIFGSDQTSWASESSFSFSDSELGGMSRVEKEEIMKSIMLCNGNVSQAARKLGISRSTFYRKLSKYKIT